MLRIRLDRFCLNSLGVLAFGTRESARRILTGHWSALVVVAAVAAAGHRSLLRRARPDEDHSLASSALSLGFFLPRDRSFLRLRFFGRFPGWLLPQRGGSFAPYRRTRSSVLPTTFQRIIYHRTRTRLVAIVLCLFRCSLSTGRLPLR